MLTNVADILLEST